MPTTEKKDQALKEPCALFVMDVGGWWTFKGIHVDREAGIKTLEIYKHGRHTRGIVALELPSGHKIYEWVKDG
jgi:hypothetical protein